ncbi:hypothetical protein PR002_g10565 [Phytophthora rubi]|uniref:Uncharacterized protein n=1 Tax=Phytophthora rubi TaxID=129364 RepID=A0A6A3M8D6_9STRA|nr:hypothetical protein PR002_g10565 [Phytophthora rubi]
MGISQNRDPLYSRFPKQGPAAKEGPYVGHTTVGACWRRGAAPFRTRGLRPTPHEAHVQPRRIAAGQHHSTIAPWRAQAHEGAAMGKELDSYDQLADPALDEMRLNQRLDAPAQKLDADLVLDDGVELDGCKLRAKQALGELRLD